jgi:GT2 family glycosyltransferase
VSVAPPDVSVLLVAHGAWEWTERALAALDEHTRQPHEVIVVDNASPDGTAASVRMSHPGVVLIENADNVGFGPANNQAASVARAPVLVLLNTDAIVGPGWLEPLLAAVERRGVGAAVPQLLHLDGTLQEAGALLGADGTVASHGDGGDPDDPAFRFPRAVDFGAAACMAVRSDLFAELGGFDDRYAPAYYEDADLCMKLGDAGWMTVYEPASRVVHARYASSSGEHARELSERNRDRFVKRWADRLVGRPRSLVPPHPARVLAARDAVADGRVLVLAAAGERTRTEGLLTEVLQQRRLGRVTLLVADDPAAWDAWTSQGVEVVPAATAAEDGWLSARRGHADLVIAVGEDISPALADTQRQALILPVPPPPGALAGVLGRAGLI